jgi:1-acyl-sn-glycerol-3-phosphate acyltransferase
MAMKTLRALVRALALVLLSIILYILWMAGKVLLSSFNDLRRQWRKLIVCGWYKIAAKIIGMRIIVKGEPPNEPFFLVSNHLSYVDIIVLGAHLNCVFVAKYEINNWPGFGLLGRSIDTIFIDRSSFLDIPRVIGLINKNLDEGLGVVLFPEGTSAIGDKVLPFSPALLEPAARGNYPVSYASISYRTPPGEVPAHMSICWWGEMTFLPHAGTLLKLRSFEALITYGSHAIQADDRKTLAKSLWNAVNDQFIPVVESSSLNSEK